MNGANVEQPKGT